MSWFCSHDWRDDRLRFVPPAPVKMSRVSEELIQKSIFGFTVVDQTCVKCGKQRSFTLIGDARDQD
jgi:hypothetical protein